MILLSCVLVREREGEKLPPWSEGKAGIGTVSRPTYGALVRGLRGVLWSRISLVVIAIMFLDGLVSGYGSALTPVIVVVARIIVFVK